MSPNLNEDNHQSPQATMGRSHRFVAYQSVDGSLDVVLVESQIIKRCLEMGLDIRGKLGAMLDDYARVHDVPRTESGRFKWKSKLGVRKEEVANKLLKQAISQITGEAQDAAPGDSNPTHG